jgi:hypothetical protein
MIYYLGGSMTLPDGQEIPNKKIIQLSDLIGDERSLAKRLLEICRQKPQGNQIYIGEEAEKRTSIVQI